MTYKVVFCCNSFTGVPFSYKHIAPHGEEFVANYIIDYVYCPVRNKETGDLENPYHFEFHITDEQGNKLPRKLKKISEATFLPKEITNITTKFAKEYLTDMADFIINLIGHFICYDLDKITPWDENNTELLLNYEPKNYVSLKTSEKSISV